MKKLLILFTCLATLCRCSNEKETAPYSCSGDQELIDGVGYTVNTVSITDDCNDNTIDSKTYCVCKETHDYIQSTFIQSPFGQPCEIQPLPVQLAHPNLYPVDAACQVEPICETILFAGVACGVKQIHEMGSLRLVMALA